MHIKKHYTPTTTHPTTNMGSSLSNALSQTWTPPRCTFYSALYPVFPRFDCFTPFLKVSMFMLKVQSADLYETYTFVKSSPVCPYAVCTWVNRTYEAKTYFTSLSNRGWVLFQVFPHLTTKECPCHVYKELTPSEQIIGQ